MNGNQVIRKYVLDTDTNNQDISISDLSKRVKSLEEILEGLTGGTDK